MITHLQDRFPVQRMCEVLACPRSSFYYASQREDEPELVTAVEQHLARYPYHGYRRVHRHLRRQGWAAGTTIVRRILRELEHSCEVGRVQVNTTNSRHRHPVYPNIIKDLDIICPEQVWVGDITYIRLGRQFIYLAVVLDAYTRAVRGWQVSKRINRQLTISALRQALLQGTPTIFHSDQGSQYACYDHTSKLVAVGAAISMSDKGKPMQNGIVERFIRTFKEEHLDYSDYADLRDAQQQIGEWMEVTYNTERLHSKLGYLTPVEFEAQFAMDPLL